MVEMVELVEMVLAVWGVDPCRLTCGTGELITFMLRALVNPELHIFIKSLRRK
jgi:hypothetical protein